MALTVEEKILWFEISIHYMLAVQIIQSTNYFGRIETTRGSGESSGRPQIREELSTGDEFQQHIHPGFVPAAPQPEKMIVVWKQGDKLSCYTRASRCSFAPSEKADG